MNCLYCGQEVMGRKSRKFCNDAHKQAYWRQQHQVDQSEAMLSELEDLRKKVRNQAQTIEEREQEVTRLLGKLDVERRFLGDHQKRGFKFWLKKQRAAHIGEVGQRILSNDLIPVQGSRWLYESHLKKNGYTSDEIEQFRDLWKLMLLS